jgi:arylsulfatase A-like enzyme/cyclophilin family peptidyl-prolyl cis-trans isomerase
MSQASWLCAAAVLLFALSPPASGDEPPAGKRPPNVVIILADDAGYGDLGCYGGKDDPTPNLDRMATEGMRFTDFYVAQAVCSASRTALLTGCYPNRVGILGALGPASRQGIGHREKTIADLLKTRGYATAVCGKWHLGHHPQFLPTRHGFDEYFGLPYSNDMWPHHPTANFPDLPLLEGEKVVGLNPDQSKLTTWYTERAVGFIAKNKDRPFFLYVAHSMPHVPLFVSDKFKGKSKHGLYGDVILELDWSVGQILAALKEHHLDEQTLVLFTSDNGPWLSYGDHAGSAGPLREGKFNTWEGGVRMPCVVRWPGQVPAGAVCREPAMTIDLLPTLAKLAGAALPEHKIDGLDIWPLLAGKPGAKNPHEAYFFYWDRHLQAIRSGRWKLHFPHPYRTLAGKPGGTGGKPAEYGEAKTPRALFDLEQDPGETTDVADRRPDVVARLEKLADAAREDLGDSATKRPGKGVRPADVVPAKTVRVLIQTEKGDIELELNAEKAPATTANFLKYADGKFYDGGRFHRTVTRDNQPDDKVKIEVIQAGANPEKAKDELPPIKLERTRDTSLRHKDGTVSMARDGPDTATSDFFVCVGDQPELDFGGRRNPDGQGFAAFGRVVKGMDVVKKIQAAPAEGQKLTPPVQILKVVRRP